jgi:hypothetical protein
VEQAAPLALLAHLLIIAHSKLGPHYLQVKYYVLKVHTAPSQTYLLQFHVTQESIILLMELQHAQAALPEVIAIEEV